MQDSDHLGSSSSTAESLAETQSPLIRLPLFAAVQWNTAVGCAEREPFKQVILDGRTILAIEEGLRAAIQMERERCAKVCETHADSIEDVIQLFPRGKMQGALDCAEAIRKG